MLPTIGDLADPAKYVAPITIDGEDYGKLINHLKLMYLIRRCEKKIADQITEGKVFCPCHLAIGQEAVAIGVCSNLRKTDRVFGTHRSHAQYFAMGGNAFALFSEVLGKVTGCSKGMGGSQHLLDEKNGFIGSVPIVGATISLAAGAALAAKMDKKEKLDLGVCFFGDGSCEEGTMHETLNLASNYKLPMLFICENNLFASHLHISLRQPSDTLSRFAEAHKVPFEIVDGNDLVAVSKAAKKLGERARNGEGPGFLETVTYRWLGHVGPREDLDVGVKRNEDLFRWKNRDPIKRLFESLISKKALTQNIWQDITAQIDHEVDADWQKAEAAPYPKKEDLLGMVYENKGESSK